MLTGWARRLGAPGGRRPRLVLLAAFAVDPGDVLHQPGHGPASRTRRAATAVYRPVLARGDGHMMYLMARSTALDGDWRFDNDLARFGDPWRQRTTKTGRKAIAHPIGPALVWTPLIWIAQGGAVVANVFGADIQLHGYTLWHQRFVFLSSALFACGAALLGARLARRLLGGAWAATYAAVAVLLGTSLTYYATYMPSYAHAMDAFSCAGFPGLLGVHGRAQRSAPVARARRAPGDRDADPRPGAGDGRRRRARGRGRDLGAPRALERGREVVARRRAPRWPSRCVVFVPQLVEWHLVFGSVRELPQGARYTRLEAPMVTELLFAPRNGWFSTTPIAYAGGDRPVRLAAARAAGRRRAWSRRSRLQVYLNSTILDWWGSAAFGQRRMCNVTLPLVIGLASLLWRCGQLARRLPIGARHAIAVAILGPFVAWNLSRVGTLRAGVSATEALVPACCDRVPPVLRPGFAAVYRLVGDPFELPASAWFAWRHGVPIDRWDHAVGNYPLIPGLDALLDDSLWAQRGVWRIGSGGLEPYLVRGWSRPVKPVKIDERSESMGSGDPAGSAGGAGGNAPRGIDRALRWTTAASATVLVPNLMPYGQRLTLWLAPAGAHHATVRWNGAIVADVELAGWTPVAFDLPDIALHTNELSIEATPAAFVPAAGPAPEGPVGVAVGDLELAFLHPDPAR